MSHRAFSRLWPSNGTCRLKSAGEAVGPVLFSILCIAFFGESNKPLGVVKGVN